MCFTGIKWILYTTKRPDSAGFVGIDERGCNMQGCCWEESQHEVSIPNVHSFAEHCLVENELRAIDCLIQNTIISLITGRTVVLFSSQRL